MAPRPEVAVFLHGAPGRGEAWSEVTRRAPSGWRCECLTLPDNVTDAPQTTLATLLEATRAALDAQARPVVLVGHSLGGWLATRLAAHPAVARVVLVASTDVYRRPLLDGVEGMVATLEANPAAAGAVAEAIARGWLAGTTREDLLGALHQELAAVPPARLARVGRRILETVSHEERSWTAPTALLHAVDDATIPFAWAEALAARLPDARVVPVERGGHVPHVVRPELVAREVFQ